MARTRAREPFLLAAAALIALGGRPALAEEPALAAPNVVVISPKLVTSGQPTAQALESLGARGFDAVVYLAPPTVADAVKDEPMIVARQGLVFVNIPIKFENPTERDYETFAAVLAALSGRKVLVHCQINLRASSMVFLYRAIAAREDPSLAFDSVTKVWSPHGPWKRLIEELLRKHAIDFEPL